MSKWVRDVRMVREFLGISDHYLVTAKLKMKMMRWIRKDEGRKKDCGLTTVTVEEI